MSLALVVGSCVGNDSPTGTGRGAAVDVGVQPALIPTPADGDALPINRVRVSVARVSDGLEVATTTTDVTPTDSAWAVDASVPEPFSSATVHVFVWLLNVGADGTESVQFSGRSDPVELVPGDAVAPDIPIVRGPVANLFTTGVTITSAPAGLAEGGSATLEAVATTSAATDPTVYWTSLTPAVVTMSGSTATAVAGGRAAIVASAGAFADTATFDVLPALAITTTALPNGQPDVFYSQTLVATGGDGSYDWSVSAGALPSGLELDAVEGVVFGTPTTVEIAAFTVQVTSGGQTATQPLSITVASGAPASFAVTETGDGTVVDESGTTDTFDVVLGAQPLTDVVLDATSANTAEATVSPATLTFTNASWSTPQTVTVTGVDDDVVDGIQLTDVTISVDAASSDDAYDAVADRIVSVVTTDDDGAGPGVLVTWTGGGDASSWSDGANWSSGAGPASGDSVVIRGVNPNTVLLDVDADIHSLVIGGAGGGNQSLNVVGFDLRASANVVVDTSAFVSVGPADTISSGQTITVTDGGTLNLEASTVDGDFENQGLLYVRNASVVTGPFRTTSTSSIVIEGLVTEGVLTVQSGFTNNGLIELTDGEAGYGTLTVEAGTLVNAATGTIRALPGVGNWGRFIFGELDNRGTVEVTGSLSLSSPTGLHLNSGTISTTAGSFTVNLNAASFTNEAGGSIQAAGTGAVNVYFPNSGAPSFTNAGAVTIGDGLSFTLSGAAGSFDIVAGSTVTNNGLLSIGGGLAVNAPAFAQTGSGTLLLSVTTWNGSGTLTNPAGATLDLRQAVVNADLENRGDIYTLGATVNGRLIVPNTELATFTTDGTPYALDVAGVDVDGAQFISAVLRIDGADLVQFDNVSFQNQDLGATQLWVTHPGAGSPFTFDSLTFAPTDVAYVRATDSDIGDGTTLTITLTNSIPLDGSTFTTEENAVVNWGTPAPTLNAWTGGAGDGLWSSAGNWSGGVPSAYDSVVVDLDGLYSISLDQNVTIHSLTLAALDIAPSVSTNGFDLDLAADLTVLPLNGIQLAGGTVTAGGVVDNQGSVTLQGVTVAAGIANQGTLAVTDTSSVTGPLTTTSSSVIQVAGQDSVPGWLTVTGDLTNFGSIELTQGSGAEAPAILSVTGTLINDVDASIQALTSPGNQVRLLIATLDNRGVVSFANPLGLVGPPGAAHVNSGTLTGTGSLQISLDGGSFLNQNGGVLSLTNTASAAISLSNDATFTNEGSVTVGPGTALSASGLGTLDLSTGSWASQGLVAMNGGITVVSPPQFLNSGASTILQITDATWTGGVLVNQLGATLQAGLVTFEADLVNEATFELLADVTVTGQLDVPDGQLASFSGNGVLTAGGVTFYGDTTMDGVPIVIDVAQYGGTLVGFANVTFQNMDPAATQLTVIHPGPGSNWDFVNLTFFPLADPATGFYVRAEDPVANGSTFNIQIFSGTANGPAFTERVGVDANLPQVTWF